MNKVILCGHLGNDPETKEIESGIKVTKFSIATNESYKDKDGVKNDITDWHNIVLWRTLSNIAENNLKKGDRILIEGKIKNKNYEDKNGVKKYFTEIIGENLLILTNKE